MCKPLLQIFFVLVQKTKIQYGLTLALSASSEAAETKIFFSRAS